MNIQTIGPNFQGKRDNVNALINMSDDDIKKLAYLKTKENSNDKRNRRRTNALFYSAPIAAGLAQAVFNNKSTKLASKVLTGNTARVANGLKTAGYWGASLAALDLLGFATNKLINKHSETSQDFTKNHPLLSIGGMLAAGLGTIALTGKGIARLGKLKPNKMLTKMTEKAANFLNTNKTIVKMQNGLAKISKNTHPALKELGAITLDTAPTALLLGGMFSAFLSGNKTYKGFENNYFNLKAKQEDLAKARIAELEVENDILKQDLQNKEEIEVLEDNLTGMPEEVMEKVEALQTERAEEV